MASTRAARSVISKGPRAISHAAAGRRHVRTTHQARPRPASENASRTAPIQRPRSAASASTAAAMASTVASWFTRAV